jgi:ribonuclease P protein component
VARNRVRRRLRAIVHDLGPELPPGAYLVRAAPEAASLSYDDLRASVAAATRAATGKDGR